MSTDSRYWLVTGRIPYDDDDSIFAVSEPCSKQEAEAQFRQFMVDAEIEVEDEESLR